MQSHTWTNKKFKNYASTIHTPMPLKVLTNEKRGGMNLVSFDWSPIKLFSLGFSKESVQTPPSERPKTAQRTPFLLFENNYCIPITA